jgi:transposase
MNATQIKTPSSWIGIDISKDQLDLHSSHPDLNLPSSVSNSIEGHRKLLKLIAHFSEIKIIFEATGGYEKPLLRTLQKAGIHATRINPAQVRSFAKAKGLLAKTDAIDAKLLAHYGELFAPKATPPIDPELAELQDLIKYRRHLRDQLHREKMQLEHEHCKPVMAMIRRRIKSLQKQLETLSQTIADRVEKSEAIRPAIEILTTVKGVAEFTAASLLAAMPELGTLTRKQAAALAGVAPINCDSGTMRGRQKTYGGRCEIREALYMAAVVSSRFEPLLRDFYQSLLQNGKAKKVALTAVMRKLLIHLNSLMRRHLQEKSAAH